MAEFSSFCLAFGQATLPKNRRLLCTEASSVVRQVWHELLAEKLEQVRLEVDVESVLRGKTPGCVCKKCFMAVKAFHEKKTHLLNNMDAAIDKMPTSARSSIMPEVGDTPTRQRRKRACHFMSEEAAKRRRVSSENIHSFPTGSSPMSPGVQVYFCTLYQFSVQACVFLSL